MKYSPVIYSVTQHNTHRESHIFIWKILYLGASVYTLLFCLKIRISYEYLDNFKKLSFLIVKFCNINAGVKPDRTVELEKEKRELEVRRKLGKEGEKVQERYSRSKHKRQGRKGGRK